MSLFQLHTNMGRTHSNDVDKGVLGERKRFTESDRIIMAKYGFEIEPAVKLLIAAEVGDT